MSRAFVLVGVVAEFGLANFFHYSLRLAWEASGYMGGHNLKARFKFQSDASFLTLFPLHLSRAHSSNAGRSFGDTS